MLTLSYGANGEPTNIQLKADAYMQQVMSLAAMIYGFLGRSTTSLNYCLRAKLLLKIRSSWPLLRYCDILEYLPLLSFIENNALLCWKERAVLFLVILSVR